MFIIVSSRKGQGYYIVLKSVNCIFLFLVYYSTFSDCGDIYEYSPGEITSPGYPNRYPKSTSCAWLIKAPVGTQIVLTIHHVDIERHSTCHFDHLLIRNGLSTDSPAFNKLCEQNSTVGKTITSGSNGLRLEFQSDNTVQRIGFRITWKFSSSSNLMI